MRAEAELAGEEPGAHPIHVAAPVRAEQHHAPVVLAAMAGLETGIAGLGHFQPVVGIVFNCARERQRAIGVGHQETVLPPLAVEAVARDLVNRAGDDNSHVVDRNRMDLMPALATEKHRVEPRRTILAVVLLGGQRHAAGSGGLQGGMGVARSREEAVQLEGHERLVALILALAHRDEAYF
ncbi:hypothetical protein D3C78_1240550 [compost metagenome]